MKKVELLCPVGTRECLEAAIHNGADAVYLSGKSFGARKFAGNFTNQELVDAIDYSHLYGVKVYITVNTIIYEEEVEGVLEYLRFLYENNVDAVIMQDIGIIKAIRNMLPELEIHASTQCHNHNKEGIELLKDLGIKRVVLDREMSLNDIKKLDIDIEKEVFVHGALCVCYSGCCLFSSMNGGRSGNRGECVQSCRMPYKLVENNDYIKTNFEYLLSTRELNTINDIGKLIDAGIDSFKIEGRMKAPSYVAFVTRLYRNYIDKYYNNEDMMVKDSEIINLSKLFNRKFTSGYINNDNNIMNMETPNHQGIGIGKVIEVDRNKIVIKLWEELKQNDGIRFKNSNMGMMVNKLYNKDNLLVNSSSDIVILDNKIGLKDRDLVLKTVDYELEKNLTNYKYKRIGINYYVEAHKGHKLMVRLDDGYNMALYKGDVVVESINSPISREKIRYQLSKLGDTIYKVNNIEISMDNDIFISIKILNEIRRQLVNELDRLRIGKKKISIKREDKKVEVIKDNKIRINILVRNKEQLESSIKCKVDSIYVTDYDLYLKYKEKYNNIYYRTKRVNNNYLEADKVLVTELGGVKRYQGSDIVTDYYLNVVNSNSIGYLEDLGVSRVTLSVEDDYDYLKDIDFKFHNVELIIYGRIELMITKYCPLKEIFKNCNSCLKKNKYYLEDKFKNRYPIVKDDCLTHIMHYKNIDKRNNLIYYIDVGINNFRIELFDETADEVENLLLDIRKRYMKW